MTPSLRLTALALLLLPPRLRADAPAPAPGPALAQALARLGPPATGVALAVGADEIFPPRGADPAVGQPTTLVGVAADYGLITQDFGPVTALAPATMTVLNADPADPNPYLDMGKDELLPLLTASLSDAQWRAMTGPDGVALADLTGDGQRQIVAALFPDPRLHVAPFGSHEFATRDDIAEVVAAQQSGKPFSPRGLRDVTDDLPRARLRLGQKAAFMLPTAQAERGGYLGVGGAEGAGAPPAYAVFPDAEAYTLGAPDPHPKDALYGIRMAADAPNAPKDGDLDYDAAALQAAVPLAGLKTVGDLVARLGALTHIELYADPHLAGRTLTVLGAGRAATASGLLRALALCLTGAFRKVGPAYVLTENVVGAGVVHQRWDDVQTQVMGQKETMLAAVRTALAARHSPRDLQGLGDPTDLTDAQLAQALKPGGAFEGDAVYPPGTLFLPLARLTPGQQRAVRGMAAAMSGTADREADFSHNVMLSVEPTWQLVLPSLDGPVSLGGLISVGNLFEFPPTRGRSSPAGMPRPVPPPAPRPPALADVFRLIPRRAVLAKVKTTQDVDSLVASLRAAGFNQLWLVTFSQGVDHSDLLAEALRAARGTGVAVFAVLDLLAWGERTPDALRARNVFGDDSAQADARLRRTDPALTLTKEGMEYELPPPSQIVADPASPAVQERLTALVKSLAARPGLAGLVWRADEPPGYDPLAPVNEETDRKLGYDDALRLAFLRRTHADPLDVAPNHDSLPMQWAASPAGAARALLGGLHAAAGAVAPALPILVRQRHDSEIGRGWYDSWDDPRRPPPTYHSPQDQGPSAAPDPPPARDAQAKAQSRVALTLMRGWPDESASFLAQYVQDEMAGHPWDGFVLDFTLGAAGPTGDPLAALAGSLTAPHALGRG